MKRGPLFMITAVGVCAHALHAQNQPSGAPELSPPPATQACAACHGAGGEGNASMGAPRIAGQSQHYLQKQLESYANGSRRNAIMEPIARGLSAEMRGRLASHYARLATPATGKASGSPDERGLTIATKGNPEARVQACRNCHGPGGIGEPPAVPYLAGLDANYIAAALNAWKSGTRRNDAGKQMALLAKAMTPEDVSAVARYYASLPPPNPPPLDIVRAPIAPDTTRAASGSVTSAREDSRANVGIEQGSATMGGSEGAGGSSETRTAPRSGARPAASGAPNRQESQSGASPDAGSTATRTAPGVASGTGVRRAVNGDPARGRMIVASGAHGCAACHTIPGIRFPRGVVGPSLDAFAQRPFIAGQLPNKPDVLVAFLQDPARLVPKTGMPNIGLTAEEARDIAAFLYNEPSDAR